MDKLMKRSIPIVRNSRGETSRFSIARFVRDAVAREVPRKTAVADGRRLLRAARGTLLDVITTDDIRHWIAERDSLVFAHRRAVGAGNAAFQRRGDEDDEEKVTPQADVEIRFGEVVDEIMPADADYSKSGTAGTLPRAPSKLQTFFLYIIDRYKRNAPARRDRHDAPAGTDRIHVRTDHRGGRGSMIARSDAALMSKRLRTRRVGDRGGGKTGVATVDSPRSICDRVEQGAKPASTTRNPPQPHGRAASGAFVVAVTEMHRATFEGRHAGGIVALLMHRSIRVMTPRAGWPSRARPIPSSATPRSTST